MKQFLAQLITETDNTADTIRVLGGLAIVTYLGCAVNAYVIKGQAFDPQAFGIGIATALGGLGGALWAKSKEGDHT